MMSSRNLVPTFFTIHVVSQSSTLTWFVPTVQPQNKHRRLATFHHLLVTVCDMATLKMSVLILTITSCYGGDWILKQYVGSSQDEDIWPTFIYKTVEFNRKPYVRCQPSSYPRKVGTKLLEYFSFQIALTSAIAKSHANRLFWEKTHVTWATQQSTTKILHPPRGPVQHFSQIRVSTVLPVYMVLGQCTRGGMLKGIKVI